VKEIEEENRSRARLMVGASGVLASTYSILGGLSFNASVFILAFWSQNLLAGDIVSIVIAMLTLMSTLFFICGSFFCAFTALHARVAKPEFLTNALHLIGIAQILGMCGTFLIFAALIIMALYIRWELAAGLLTALIFVIVYVNRYMKKRKARIFVTSCIRE